MVHLNDHLLPSTREQFSIVIILIILSGIRLYFTKILDAQI